MFLYSVKHLHANFQLVDSGEFFPSAASNSGLNPTVGYLSSEVEVLIYNGSALNVFCLKRANLILFKKEALA
jgi:hypothetical protein